MPRSGSPAKNDAENDPSPNRNDGGGSRASSRSFKAASSEFIDFGTHEDQQFAAAAELALDVSLHYETPGFEMVHVGMPVSATPSPAESTGWRTTHGNLDDVGNDPTLVTAAVLAPQTIPSVIFERTMDVMTEVSLPRSEVRTCPDDIDPYSTRTSTSDGKDPTMKRHTSGSFI